jgi:hypothetical protein
LRDRVAVTPLRARVSTWWLMQWQTIE